VVLSVNKIANPTLDIFAIGLTQLGLGIVMAVVAVLFALWRYYYAIATAISLIFTGIFTGILKKIIFKGMPRPTGFFDPKMLHHLMPNFDYHTQNTFPSGHSMTAIAIMLLLAFAINKKGWSVVLAVLGITVAFTRVYLLQHFFLDIYVGSFLGIVCTLIGLYFAQLILKPHSPLRQKGLLKLKF